MRVAVLINSNLLKPLYDEDISHCLHINQTKFDRVNHLRFGLQIFLKNYMTY